MEELNIKSYKFCKPEEILYLCDTIIFTACPETIKIEFIEVDMFDIYKMVIYINNFK